MPLFRRVAKRGFNNKQFASVVLIVNLSTLEQVFEAGDDVTPETLVAKGIAKGKWDVVKVLGDGALTKKLSVRVHRFSKSAEEKIAAAGGTVEWILS